MPFFLLQATLGLSVDAARRCVMFYQPTLPAFLQQVELNNLRVGSGSIDLMLERHTESIGVEVTRRDAGIEVMVVK